MNVCFGVAAIPELDNALRNNVDVLAARVEFKNCLRFICYFLFKAQLGDWIIVIFENQMNTFNLKIIKQNYNINNMTIICDLINQVFTFNEL